MSTNPSTRTIAGYGASSPLDRHHSSDGVLSSRSSPIQGSAKKLRRDSAAPLMHTPPITITDPHSDPLSSLHGMPSARSLADRHSRPGLHYRRRRKTETTTDGGSDDEDDTEALSGTTSEVDLNTSDEESAGSEDEEDYPIPSSTTTTQKRASAAAADSTRLPPTAAATTTHRANNNEVRIGGLGYHLNDPSNPPWRQQLLLEEDVEVVIEGYRYDRLQLFMYRLMSVFSFGLVALLCRWMPQWWVAWVGQRAPLCEAQWLLFVNQYGEREILRPQREFYGGTIGSVFSVEQLKEELNITNDDSPGSQRYLNMDEKLNHLILVEYRYIRLAFHPLLQRFLIVGFWKDSQWTSVKSIKSGLTTEKYFQRLCAFGPNLINIREKPTTKLLTDEVLNPFYVFQIASIILWSLDDYYYYAFCIFVISAVSIITSLVETKQNMKRMRDMSRFECSVRTLRNGSWRIISSVDLVPGDLIDIQDLHTVPCDALVISGDCILNESMLTGESVPVSKVPVTDALLRKMNLSTPNIPAEINKYFLFMGTKVVRVRSGGNVAPATAMVVRTGFNSAKGALVRSMLFPKPNNFKFYRDSFRFIGVLSIIAVIGFLLSSINFIRLGIDKKTMLLRALDLITIVVPPALPATMSIGTSFAIQRMKNLGIFCISPPRVNIGGKVDCMCFDKTGTLTEDGLDIHGIRSVSAREDGSKTFEDETKSLEGINAEDHDSKSTKARILRTMTTCHSLKIVNGELIGDPLDLKMFEYTEWELEESSGATSSGLRMRSELAAIQAKKSAKVGIMPTVVRPPGERQELSLHLRDSERPPIEYGIIHTFEFVSALRRMSVIVRRLADPSMEIFVKGAPEVMADICRPETLPEDYQQTLYWYTHRGYRVIACASRRLDGVKWHKLHKLKRHEVESNLTFLGFIIFENKLKARTIPSIATLRSANIRQIMCTGDNVLTAISVSRECGLIEERAEVYAPRFLSGSSTEPDSQIVWESVMCEGQELNGDTLEPQHRDVYGRGYYLAVTGEAFRWMVDYAPTELLYRMLVKGVIYARMSPDEKQELVSELQRIGYCVGFCGDGANDCGALKAGDIGISLSEAEASVAAPFTSKVMDIACVIDVIKEGRAALVTSFSCFKYMALYSIIQFTSVTLLYSFGSNLGDFQFLYIDLFLILPIAVYMGYTSAWPYLAKKRPTASLVSKRVLTSLIGQILVNSLFQIALYYIVRTQDWYVEPVFDPDGENIECQENTILFLLSSYQYILIAVVFSVGPPYRQPLWTNGRLVLTLTILITLTTWCTLYPSAWAMSLLELEAIPFSFRLFIVFLALANLVVSLLCEKYIFPQLASWISSAFKAIRSKSRAGYTSLTTRKQHKKIYKRVMDEMGILDLS